MISSFENILFFQFFLTKLNELSVGKPGDSIQASLADVPPLHKMTGKRLGNATQLDERFSNYHSEIENNLISHSSPSQRIPVDSNNNGNNNNESDKDSTIHNVQECPINRSGISESSVSHSLFLSVKKRFLVGFIGSRVIEQRS